MTDLPPRRLALLRHAEAMPSAGSDHERDLAPNGPEQAREAAAWLAAHGFRPDHVLVSDALRTRRTAQLVLDVLATPDAPEPLVDQTRAMYEAGPETVLDLLASVPADTRMLLVVGHNPTIAQLVQLVDDGTGAQASPGTGFPPASVALFEVPGEWLRLGFCSSPLVGLRSGTGNG